MRFRSSIILNIPQYYFHMVAILKNGYHFFSAEYRQGSPPRSCAGRSPEHIDTQHVFTAAHVRWTPKTGFCSLGIVVNITENGSKCNDQTTIAQLHKFNTFGWNYNRKKRKR